MRLGLSELKRWRWRWLGLGYFLTVVMVSGYVLLALYTNTVGPEDTSGLSGIWLWFVNAPSSALSLLFYGATGRLSRSVPVSFKQPSFSGCVGRLTEIGPVVMRRNLAESPVSDHPGGGRVSEKGDTRTSEYAGRSGAGDLALRQASVTARRGTAGGHARRSRPPFTKGALDEV
jgi:hypothetical protein